MHHQSNDLDLPTMNPWKTPPLNIVNMLSINYWSILMITVLANISLKSELFVFLQNMICFSSKKNMCWPFLFKKRSWTDSVHLPFSLKRGLVVERVDKTNNDLMSSLEERDSDCTYSNRSLEVWTMLILDHECQVLLNH